MEDTPSRAANTVYPPSGSVSPVWPPAQVGDYRLGRLLGEGGMGAVFEAEDIHLNRRAAVKLMKPGAHADAAARTRFLREAKLMASVDHDHIVRVFAVGGQDAIPFIAMERLTGGTLDDRMKQKGAIPYASAVVLARQIAEALAAAHAKGLVHRDVKPSNVWLESTDDGKFRRVKLLDFGLTRPVESGNEGLTSTGAIVGTPAYMSPEQAHGKPVDPRTDLFSLGVVLYEMLTGQRPFVGSSQLEVLMKITTHSPESASSINPKVPGPIAALVDRLLAKAPDGRPPSAKAVADELRKLAKSMRAGTDEAKLEVVVRAEPHSETKQVQATVVRRVADLAPPKPPPPTRRWLLAAGAVVPVAGVGGYLAFGGREWRQDSKATPASGLVTLSHLATGQERANRLQKVLFGTFANTPHGTAFAVTPDGLLLTSKRNVEPIPRDGMVVVTDKSVINPAAKVYRARILHLGQSADFAILQVSGVRFGDWLALCDLAEKDIPRIDILAAGYPPLEQYWAVRSGRVTAAVEIGAIAPGRPQSWLAKHNAVGSGDLEGGPLVAQDGTALGILMTLVNKEGKAESNLYGHALTLPQLRAEIDQHCPGVTWRTPKLD